MTNSLDHAAKWPSPIMNQADAADRFEELAKALKAAGLSDLSDVAFDTAATIDLADPELQKSWGGGFNGQEGRRALFLAVVEATKPTAILETGTFRGTTTEWMAERFSGPILTCEVQERYYLQSRKKLSRFPNVSVFLSDSRAFLREQLRTFERDKPVFIYLDAHWYDDLPLAEELEIIFDNLEKAVVMIDDYEVPFDPGYSYDYYGPDKALTLNLLKGAAKRDGKIFFPTLPAERETGARRGCCVVTSPGIADKLKISELQPVTLQDWRVTELKGELESTRVETARLYQELSRKASVLATAETAGLVEFELETGEYQVLSALSEQENAGEPSPLDADRLQMQTQFVRTALKNEIQRRKVLQEELLTMKAYMGIE
ncbi:hypothetical protein [Microvirga flavescens]|uniref:hypothetical protein n=1 Tax=Microvirga flavescens TaxID=2249811 RepID=UPI00130027C8|nr:hypothetical protein [Microvirga flavescens]